MGSNAIGIEHAKQLLRQLETGELSPDDAYRKLMRDDADTLTLLNRLVTEQRRSHKTLLHEVSLVEAIARCLTAWKLMIIDVSDPANASWKGIRRTFWEAERRIFLGVLLIIISTAVYFVDSTT